MPAQQQQLTGLKTLPPELLQHVTLELGTHSSRNKGICAMEAVAWLAGEAHNHNPGSACPTLTDFIITLNDHLSKQDRNRILKPHLPAFVGTSNGKGAAAIRAAITADWLIRTSLPIWLSDAGWHQEAEKLANVPAPQPAPTHMDANRLLKTLAIVQYTTTLANPQVAVTAQANAIVRESGTHAAASVHSVPANAADIAAASASLMIAKAQDVTETIEKIQDSLTALLEKLSSKNPEPPAMDERHHQNALTFPHMRIPSTTTETTKDHSALLT